MLVAALALASELVVIAPAVPGGLHSAQARARELIQTRPTEDIKVVVQPGVHLLTSPLVLGPADSGERGRFRVVWSAASAGTAQLDGGVTIEGPWKLEEQLEAAKVWSVALPAVFHNISVRQLYVSGNRYSRTHSNPCNLGFPPAKVQGASGLPVGCSTDDNNNTARQTATGFNITVAATQLKWRDVSSVELVSDHTWVQHRCPVIGVVPLPSPAPTPPPPPTPPASCEWGPKVTGRSPGSSLKKLPASTYTACQEECCGALPNCKGVVFNSENCYLLDRKVTNNISAAIKSYRHLPV